MKNQDTNDLPVPHSYEWYDRLSSIQEGYFYPWKSDLGDNNGEEAFLTMLFEMVQPTDTGLDAGCGHGKLTLKVAERAKYIVGYDRTEKFIELALQCARDQGGKNCNFIVGDSHSPDPNDKSKSRIPVENTKFDLIYSRRGPLNYIHDVKRVSRIGTRVIQLNPAHINPAPWVGELPPGFRTYFQDGDEFAIKDALYNRLQSVGLDFDSYWFFDFPDLFDERHIYLATEFGCVTEIFFGNTHNI